MDELVERARRGDRQAVEQLLADIAPSVYRFGRRMCGNAHDAEDVLQDTLMNVVAHLDGFEGRSSLSSWVFALTRSACSRRRRGAKNQPPVSGERAEEQRAAGHTPEADAAERELVATLVAELETLPLEQREVILLRDVEGLTAPETAAALGIGVEAVKSRLHRARQALRERLRPRLEPSELPARGDCPDVMTLWSRKLEGELDQADCAAMEAHLKTCAACAGACDALRTALLACRHAASADVPAVVQERVKAAARAWSATHAG